MVVPEGCCFGTMHGVKEQHKQVLDCAHHAWVESIGEVADAKLRQIETVNVGS